MRDGHDDIGTLSADHGFLPVACDDRGLPALAQRRRSNSRRRSHQETGQGRRGHQGSAGGTPPHPYQNQRDKPTHAAPEGPTGSQMYPSPRTSASSGPGRVGSGYAAPGCGALTLWPSTGALGPVLRKTHLHQHRHGPALVVTMLCQFGLALAIPFLMSGNVSPLALSRRRYFARGHRLGGRGG